LGEQGRPLLLQVKALLLVLLHAEQVRVLQQQLCLCLQRTSGPSASNAAHQHLQDEELVLTAMHLVE
jgi:hypothetical protein